MVICGLQVLAVLPTDPYEQLKLAHKISSRAYTQKVSSLESEVGQLRRALADKNGHIRTLETSLTSCKLELQEANEKARPENPIFWTAILVKKVSLPVLSPLFQCTGEAIFL